MASTYSTSLKLELIGNGDQSGVWGTTTNKNLGTLLEQAITGVQSFDMRNDEYPLSSFNGTSDEARNAVLVATGTNSATRKILAPLVKKTYIVYNDTDGGFAITIGGATGNVATIPNGVTTLVYCDGVNFYNGLTGLTGDFTITGNATVSGNLGVGTTTPSVKLDVQGTGSDHQLSVKNTGTATSDDAIILVQTSSTGTTSTISGLYFGDGDSQFIGRLNYNHSDNSMAFFTNSTEKVSITSAGRVGIGTNNPSYKLAVYDAATAISALQGDSTTQFIVQRSSADATGGFVQFYKSRGTVAAPTIVADDDITGRMVFYGYSGTSGFIGSAEVRGAIDGTPGATNDMPGRLTFYTTPNGSGTLTERMRIDSTGLITVASGGGLSIDATDVTGTPAATNGNVFSGTYTPNLTNTTNVAASSTGTCQYMRVGNVVTVSGLVDINPTTAGSNTVLRMTLPIASTFTSSDRLCAGTAASVTSGTYGQSLGIFAYQSATGQAEFRGDPTVATSQEYAFSFTYRII
jgi:hypothetical protein